MNAEQKQALIEWLREGIDCQEEYGLNGNLLTSMRVALAALTVPAAPVTPQKLCIFVSENFAQYQGAWLCGKSSEILCYLLSMAGFKPAKIASEVSGYGHMYVACAGLRLDPSVKQFGDYNEVETLDFLLPDEVVKSETDYTAPVQVPEKWQLVPVEPTEEMIAAGDQFMDGLSRLSDAYDAMLAAAPEEE